METQDPLYYERMDSSIGDKKKIIPYIKGERVLDIGCGDGVLLEALQNLGLDAYGLDATEESVNRTIERGIPKNKVALAYAHEIVENFSENFFDTMICSSIIHEVFSYGTPKLGILSTQAVDDTFKAIYQALKPGGRIIIRDGIIPEDWNKNVKIIFNPNNPSIELPLVEKYLNMIPFRAETTQPTYRKVDLHKLSEYVYEGTTESIMEFLYTYTWGEKAFHRETQELYGFNTLTKYVKYLETFGFKIIHTESYLQEGYSSHLKNKVMILDDWAYREFFDSNAIIVATKN